jgi:hypothetical protein
MQQVGNFAFLNFTKQTQRRFVKRHCVDKQKTAEEKIEKETKACHASR